MFGEDDVNFYTDTNLCVANVNTFKLFTPVSSVEISKSTDKRSDKYETDIYNLSEGDLCIFVFLYF